MIYDYTKRALDIALALLLVVVGLPLWLLIAAVVKLDSPGPVFYSAIVHGRGCRPFRYYKFRTMWTGASTACHEALTASYIQGVQSCCKLLDDPRVTRVGRLLRVWSLDEVPQLVNVLRGEMSLVGPRPPLTYEFKLYDVRARRRLAVRPGITGLQQVTSRGRVSFRRLVATDLLYIRRRSLALDLVILARTIPAVLSRRGAA
ncbi:MAG: sugar transferase [Chloroflexi bacterium]|nr:sugar transferase [Chloroflexota bacterium]MCY3958967.1 sugar transferase [Chloroflexota bacterium]